MMHIMNLATLSIGLLINLQKLKFYKDFQGHKSRNWQKMIATKSF